MTARSDPHPTLFDTVERASAELARIASSDPAARSAMLAVRLTHHTLTAFWLPALSFDERDPGD